MPARTYRAGESLEDFCRACKTDRMHTVIAADPDGRPIRVVCGFCGSEHNYRGGPKVNTVESQPHAIHPSRDPFPIVSERERTAPPMTNLADPDLEMLLRRIIREETGVTPSISPPNMFNASTDAIKPDPAAATPLHAGTWVAAKASAEAVRRPAFERPRHRR